MLKDSKIIIDYIFLYIFSHYVCVQPPKIPHINYYQIKKISKKIKQLAEDDASLLKITQEVTTKNILRPTNIREKENLYPHNNF